MTRLSALICKEFRQMFRDGGTLLIGVVLPAVLILTFGYGLSLDVKQVPVAVVLDDPSLTARTAVAGLYGSAYLAPVRAASMHEAEGLFRARTVDAIVRLPSDFAAALARNEAVIQIILHGTDAVTARLSGEYLTAALLQPLSVRSGPRVEVVSRMWFNAANTSTWYLVPGLIALIMTLVGAFLTALVMAREWERGTLEALFVTPVRVPEILLAKMIPYFCVGLAGMGICVVSARFLFGVPLYGSLWVLAAGSMLYLVVSLGMGLVISALTKNQFLASQAALLASFLPSLLLSGFLFDLRNAPPVIEFIGHLVPATWYMELVRTVFLAGDIASVLCRDGAALLAFAVVFLGVALRVTRKRLE